MNAEKKIVTIETSISFISEIDDGKIIHVEMKPSITIDTQQLVENRAAYQKFLKGRKALFLICFHKDTTILPEAREAFTSFESNQIKSGEAFVSNTLAQKILVNFHLITRKPGHPSKFFKDKKEALNWLRTLKE